MITKEISNVINLINQTILNNSIKDFTNEFYEDSNTHNFVLKCVSNGLISADLVSEWSEQQQFDYLHNILTNWVGMKYENATELLHNAEYNPLDGANVTFSVVTIDDDTHFVGEYATKTEIEESGFYEDYCESLNGSSSSVHVDINYYICSNGKGDSENADTVQLAYIREHFDELDITLLEGNSYSLEIEPENENENEL